jgi:hypothetical protein
VFGYFVIFDTVVTIKGYNNSKGGLFMVESTGNTYEGNSSGGTATFEAALKNAMQNAAKTENTNHFYWTLVGVRGDFGGVVGNNITVEIRIHN